MSGIAGFIATHPGDRIVVPNLQTIMSALAHRGPDGKGQLNTPQAALGHAWLSTDGAPGPGPYRLRSDGPILTCDIRIDEVDALASLLGVASDVAAPELILRAYDQWGTDCVTRIEGDFAFAIWDPSRCILFCARDRMGVKPLAWRCVPAGCAFASDPSALVGVCDTPPLLNENWLADFLSGQTNDVDSTAWQGIKRLQPGHVMVIAGGTGEPQFQRYWDLKPTLERPADVPDALRQELTRATKNAMRGGRAGAMLSGGLDSSTISILARDIESKQVPHGKPLPVFLLTFPDSPAMDERAYMNSVLETGGFAPYWLEQRPQGSGLNGAAKLLHEQGQPFAAPALPATQRLYSAAAQAGVRVLLDGHGGDEVISYGTSRVYELMAAGEWRSVWNETPGLAALESMSRQKMFLWLLSQGAKSRIVRGLSRRLEGSGPKQSTTAWRELVHPELTNRTNLIARTNSMRTVATNCGLTQDEIESQAHSKMVLGPTVTQNFEILNRMAAHQGIEVRYPFYDRRVVELCIAQPAAAKLRNGWTRALLRDAMRDVLPELIRKRRDKVRFNSELVRGILEDKTGRLDQLARGERIAGYINMDVLRRHLATLRREGMAVEAPVFLQIWRAAWLDIWLQQAEQQPLSQRRQA